MSQLTLVFNAAKGTAIVNGEEWTVLKRSGTFVSKRITDCTSLTLQFRSRGSSASGGLLYIARCKERPACASVAEYKGTFTAK